MKLTTKAKQQIQKLIAGEITSIEFTDMAAGLGGYLASEIDNEITKLQNIRIKTAITNKYQESSADKSKLFISTTFFNGTVDEKFEVREVGIFAKENDTEYLYAYKIIADVDMPLAIVQEKSVPQYIPISLDTGLSDIDSININVTNDLSIVNQDEFKRYKIEVKEYINEQDKLKLSKVNNLADLTDLQVARDNLNVYEKREVDVALNNKSNINHIHESLIKVYTTNIGVEAPLGSSQNAVPVTWTEILSVDNGLRKLQSSATVTVLGSRPFFGLVSLYLPRNIIFSQSNITMTGLACIDGTPITQSSIAFFSGTPPPFATNLIQMLAQPIDKDIIFTFHLDAVVA